MRLFFALILALSSITGLAQTQKRFVCDTTDTTGTIVLDLSYTIVISDQAAYLKVGSHLISLEALVVDGKKYPIYVGEDSKSAYAFYSNFGELHLINQDLHSPLYKFICH